LNGVCSLVNCVDIDYILEKTEVGEIWGVGRQLSKKLISQEIYNAKMLKYCSDRWIRKIMSINGLKTVTELRGVSCLPLEEISITRKSCCTTRTFGKSLTLLEDVEQAVTTFARRATERIRSEGLVTSSVSVFLRTSPFDRRNKYYSNSAAITLSYSTQNTILIINAALSIIRRIFKNGYKYKKAGVLLSGFNYKGDEPQTLFSKHKDNSSDLMLAIDNINERYGNDTIQIASESQSGKWKQKRMNCTPSYTTQLGKILSV
jgi:DNA polymerase V